MPKKKKSANSRVFVVVIIIAMVACAAIIYHDGFIGVTPIGDINNGAVGSGTLVTVKGEITFIDTLFDTITITDSTGWIVFAWDYAESMQLHTTVVVRGEVFLPYLLSDVSSIAVVWLFA